MGFKQASELGTLQSIDKTLENMLKLQDKQIEILEELKRLYEQKAA